jgi:hypothetical protein
MNGGFDGGEGKQQIESLKFLKPVLFHFSPIYVTYVARKKQA